MCKAILLQSRDKSLGTGLYNYPVELSNVNIDFFKTGSWPTNLYSTYYRFKPGLSN